MHSRALAFGATAALALTLWLSGCAAPDQPSNGFPPPDTEDDNRGPRTLPAFHALDRNDDGEISASEIDAAPESLASLDADGDGTLTEDELLLLRDHPVDPQSGSPAESTATFMTPDSVPGEVPEEAGLPTQTFILNAEEGEALEIADLPPQFQSFLAGADADGDGAASAAEILALMGAEAGGSGSRVQAEAEGREFAPAQTGGRRPQPSNPLMAALDANQDGVVSEAETASAATSLRGLDTDGDGRLAASELQPAPSSDSSSGDQPQ